MKPPIFLGQLLLRSMDRAVALYESMELRGFHGEFVRLWDFLANRFMLSHSAAGKNVCIESVDENDKI